MAVHIGSVKANVPRSDEERQLAFEVWMGPGGRQLRTTERLLGEEPYSTPIPYGTLWEWRKQHKWAEKADELQRASTPLLRDRFAGMAEGAAIEWMGRLVAGAHGGEMRGGDVAAARLAFEAAGFMPDKKGQTNNNLFVGAGVAARLSTEDRDRLSAEVESILALGEGDGS